MNPLRSNLQETFARRNPSIRFLDTFAPEAVRQIRAALTGAQSEPTIDLDTYCARIGYEGPRTPTIDTLRSLHEHHPAAIAFEAFDVLLDRGIDLSPAAVDRKLIDDLRGGYCAKPSGCPCGRTGDRSSNGPLRAEARGNRASRPQADLRHFAHGMRILIG